MHHLCSFSKISSLPLFTPFTGKSMGIDYFAAENCNSTGTAKTSSQLLLSPTFVSSWYGMIRGDNQTTFVLEKPPKECRKDML
jgi:hypothetical protein